MNARNLATAGIALVLLVPLACGLNQPSAGPRPASVKTAPAQGAGSGTAAPSRSDTSLAPGQTSEGSRVQRSAQMALQVPNGSFDTRLDRVMALMQSQGGYISGSQADADGSDRLRTGQLTFQVPSEKFDATIAALRRLGTPESIRITGNDVSSQYVDLQARLRNAEAQRDAMLALLQQAKSVGDIIQVQNQLGQITAQVEELKGQIDYLDHTTTYATVGVTIREAAAASGGDEWGFRSALLQALHNFVGAIDLIVIVVGTLTPLLLLGLLVGIAGWRLRARMRQQPGA
jgi:Domain of unknown function (DUF4349)